MPNQYTGSEHAIPVGTRTGLLETITDVVQKHMTTKSGRRRSIRCVTARCDCGTVKELDIYNFLSGRVKSCGCANAKAKKERGRRMWVAVPGKRYGKLTVLREVEDPRRERHVICRCGCGRTTGPIRATALTSGNTTKCFVCAHRAKGAKRRIELEPGAKYGRLTVLRPWGATAAGMTRTLAQCECGDQSIYQTANLQTGNTSQCRTCGMVGFSMDSEEEFLKDPERATSSCHVYVARINGRYVKPGISQDPERRADDFYSGYAFVSPAMERAEAWAIEQRLLRESKEARPNDLPEIYAGWGGRTELRVKSTIPEQWYVNRFWELLEELDEVGWEALVHN